LFSISRISRKVVVMDHTPSSKGYEAPELTLLGSVHALTQTQDKKYGVADGFTFMGDSITNAS
jgi:hypothetical protein